MSKFFKIGLALASSFFVTTSLFAQATIEEVIVTAQRTEQSLQDVPIAVSAFTDEVLAERQIEYASDIQLQVPGVNFTATQFGAGGFSIRGITNLATAASADAGVEIHVNGLPLGLTSVSEIQYLDMERLEVLRGPQGTLFGRNATGGVINLITAKPDLDEFYGSADIKYGQDAEQMITMMLNVPITDQLGFRLAYTNLEKDGIHENLYTRAADDFDNRDGYQWRATFLYEFDDTLRLTALHQAYDEESARNQVSGTWCETGGSLVQGCVVGGQQTFQQTSPMSNGSTLPSALGGMLGFYFPSNLGCPATANDGTCYNPLAGFDDAALGAAANGLYEAMVNVSNLPDDFFFANTWRSPIHETQESNSQILLEKDFDQGSLTLAANMKKRVFYRDTASTSKEGTTIRFSALAQSKPFYLTHGVNGDGTGGAGANDTISAFDGNGNAVTITGDGTSAMPMLGIPLGYSNSYYNPQCNLDAGQTGIFGGPDCIRGFHEHPVSGDASFSDSTSQTFEIKYASDLDGMFNFLVGAIDISNKANSFYDVYASGITMNGIELPASLRSAYRSGYAQAAACALVTAAQIADANYVGPCTAALLQGGAAIVGGVATLAGLTTNGTTVAGSSPTNPVILDPTATGFDAAAAAAVMIAAQPIAMDKIARIDGVYTEHFHNETKPFKLDSRAIFTEFYFDVAENHKLTLGLRYTEDQKSVVSRATFYDSQLVSNWSTAREGTDPAVATDCGIGGGGSYQVNNDAVGAATTLGTITRNPNAACLAIGATVGQQIGVAPGVGALAAAGNPNGSEHLLAGLDAFNADYLSANPPIDPRLEFSKTTGRLVWDWSIDDNTLMYVSYAKGFKGGGFNPPFDVAQFPNTPYAFESTDVDSLELGIKATVPEVGLVANASFYYNDFKNFHLGSIRNETAINVGIPLESYGAELELLLNPPSVPGLSFNAQLSLYDSEIGDVNVVIPYDIGGHYNGTAESANWHVVKSQSANATLVDKSRFGYIYGSLLQYQIVTAGAADDAAKLAAIESIADTNEFAAAAIAAGVSGAVEAGVAVDAAGMAAGITAAEDALLLIGALENSAPAGGYGQKAPVCHMIQLPAGNINTCMPTANAAQLTGANSVPVGVVPTASLLYSPVALTDGAANNAGNVIAGATDANLLPSIALMPTDGTTQIGGICALWDIFTTDYSGTVAGTPGAALAASPGGAITHVSALTGDDPDNAAATGIQIANDGQGNATEACFGTAQLNPGLISTGLDQNLKGNPMPFSDVTLSLGIQYTFQAGDVEVTPRLDYYYRSDANQGVYNITQNKVQAWDEINFRLNIVPTNGNWRVNFYGQNLTDERNVTATAITNSSTSSTNTVFVREPRSFGFQFGIDF